MKIKTKTKTIEMRLFDEKLSKISVGDDFVFVDNSTKETNTCKVSNLFKYKDSDELYSNRDKISIGYSENEIANPNDMLAYYSKEQIEKYGVVGIELSP
ncbi:MAG: RNA-binding protein [Eubacteriales bacterium]|nr:RNA-binding protein [Eubacteriales bacterium]